MGIVYFEGDPPYELLVTKNGKATAAGGIVRLIVPVSVPGPDPQERKIDADERGQAEALVLEFVVAGHLRLAIVVDQDEAPLGKQVQQLLQVIAP